MAHGRASTAERAPLRILNEAGGELSDLAAFAGRALRLRLYREMLRVRLLDETMVGLQRQGRVSFYGACVGQEAVPVAAALAAADDDWVFPALRESSIMLVRGLPLRQYLAQVFGSRADLLKGRQMPSHMSARSVSQVSWSSCIGTQLVHAVGAAWAARLRRELRVTLAFLGDGATSSNDFHAAMNFAGVFRPGVVFICQNNQWAISTPASRQTAAHSLADKASAYAIPSLRVDGNDGLAVLAAVREACRRARAGGGPSFVECVTYRLGAHSTSDDPTRYRSQAELDEWRLRDPLVRLRRNLEASGYWDSTQQCQLDEVIRREISSAVVDAEAVDPPPRDSLFDDVYRAQPWHLREQSEALLAGSIASRGRPL